MSKLDTLTSADTLVTPPPEPSGGQLATTLAASEPNGALSDPGGDLVVERTPDERYDNRTLLGEGGMGEVRLCKDKRFGREVAMKVVRSGHGSKGDLRARFLREARVQGQLEHPAIVPVYDVGRDAAGNLFFTMKRLRGSTLEAILARLRSRDIDTGALYTRHKLLSAFLDVCQAIHFAHARGVVHRDLKPGNVMLGSYGEVYVLDWGLAKIAGHQELRAEEQVELPDAGEAKTAVGAVMGTPGYMAPEQIAGEVGAIDGRTDVYALGVLLFEILALEPLHGEGSASELLARTLKGSSDARASVRAPDREVPPELEAICVRATSVRREDRYATARELHDAVERFLSGDRDVERRRQMAIDHVQLATEAADRALSPSGGVADRTDALREVGRALALDPSNTEAVDVFVRLTSAPPAQIPKDVAEQLEGEEAVATQRGLRTASWIYGLWFLFLPIVWLMGIRNMAAYALFNGVWLAVAVASWYQSRKPMRFSLVRRIPIILLGATGVAVASTIFGPFIMVPTLAAIQTTGAIILSPPSSHRRILALGAFAVVVPFLLEYVGVLPPSYAFVPEGMLVLPHAVSFPAKLTPLFLLVANVCMVLSGGSFALRYHRALRAAQERSALVTWQLRQLAPAAGRALASAPPPAAELCAISALVSRPPSKV